MPLFIMTACDGGGGGSGDNDDDNHPQSDFVEIIGFSVNKAAVSPNEVFSIGWEVDFNSPTAIYSMDFFITDNPENPSRYQSVNGINCGEPGAHGQVFDCDYVGAINCYYTNDNEFFCDMDHDGRYDGYFERSRINFSLKGDLQLKASASIMDSQLKFVRDEAILVMHFN